MNQKIIFRRITLSLVITTSLVVSGCDTDDATNDIDAGGTGAEYIDLGPGRAQDVNSDGSIVLVSEGVDSRIWFRETGSFLYLGSEGIDDPGSALAISASGISDDGSVVIGTIQEGGMIVAALWSQETGWVSLGGTNDGCGSILSSGFDLSGDGTRGTGLSWTNVCDSRAFEWTAEGGMIPMQEVADGGNRGNVISRDGSRVGGFAQTVNRSPALWNTADGSGDLAFGDESLGEIWALSDDGSIYGGSLWDENPIGGAFIHGDAIGLIRLGALPESALEESLGNPEISLGGSEVKGVANDASVAVGYSGNLWEYSARGFIILQPEVQESSSKNSLPGGATVPSNVNWLVDVTACSSDCLVTAGYAYVDNPSGTAAFFFDDVVGTHAFVARFPPEYVNQP